MEDYEAILLCVPLALLTDEHRRASTLARCVRCLVPVGISPRTMEAMAQRGKTVTYYCLDCAKVRGVIPERAQFRALDDQQIDEVLDSARQLLRRGLRRWLR